MTKEEHLIEREKFQWGSYGKLGDKPLRWTILKNISDSHLMRIVEHLKLRRSMASPIYDTHGADYVLALMETEVTFRTTNYIFVPETYD